MNPSIELQKQIKDNAEDVRKFVSDLSNWEEEMKRKESTARAAASKESSLPPVRNSSVKQDLNNSKTANPLGDSRSAKKRISSNDYAAWEKFDVEKACEEIDDPSLKKKSESDKDKIIRENQLRDEANEEKEKGNQFVKKEKWDNAIECYSKAIKCFSQDAIFYCNRALCYLKKKDYRAAETDCTSALTLDGSYVKALHRRGLARKELSQLDEALEDLKRAFDLEPNNTAIARDFNSVKMKVDQIRINTILIQEAQRLETEAEVMMDIGSDKNPDPILPAKKHRIPTTTKKDTSSNSITWPTVENSVVIEPVIIPPHKRSKKPLVRVQVQESANIGATTSSFEAVTSATDTSNKTNSQHATKKNLELKTKCEVKSDAPSVIQSGASSSTPPTSKSPYVTSSLPKEVPPIPKNSVQFLGAWRQMNLNKEMCFQYLKKINGQDFPKIFQDSLDGNILSQILSVLATEFVAANEPVLAYLQGLTQVRRFRTLTLFLSQSDKSNMEVLFKHTQNLEKTPTDVLENLKKEYEL
ncbi:RNA polymerase II-associated protein 3-like isoform X2 [Thrips palmi]|nr:RNA polymerase II-associated protein 3-like isoform X2 [Thrips palmi]XP_034247062.1 RNA polymerase II-associated protein 3-like isoform X2 [Thrips palmi]XP_034247063.1 RNA polymerase II-associated protein 3-like isoform X2 [Thrips palmi]XP_034247064.1 RNA polymerase II-associated protein 3-like isoform X2 [Thrips palmi]